VLTTRRLPPRKPRRRQPRVVARPPTAVIRQYGVVLVESLRRDLTRVWEVLTPAAWTSLLQERRQELGLDSWADNVDRLVEALKLRLEKPSIEVTALLENVGQRTSRWQDAEWQRTLRTILGAGVVTREAWWPAKLQEFTQANAALIQTQHARVVAHVEQAVRRGISSGVRHEVLKRDLVKNWGVEERRARLIARDQVSKLNGDLAELRQRNAGVEEYYWETSGDERVRDSHAVLSGMLCRWDDDSVYSDDDGATWQSRADLGAYEGKPGQDFQCRCWPRAKL